MREIERTTRFKRDNKRERKSDPTVNLLLIAVLNYLIADVDLPARFQDHSLGGDWKGYRDCHIKPDLVLIYAKVGTDLLRLARLGSHSEIFG